MKKLLIRVCLVALFSLTGAALGLGALTFCVVWAAHINSNLQSRWTQEQIHQCVVAVSIAGGVLGAVFALRLFRGEE